MRKSSPHNIITNGQLACAACPFSHSLGKCGTDFAPASYRRGKPRLFRGSAAIKLRVYAKTSSRRSVGLSMYFLPHSCKIESTVRAIFQFLEQLCRQLPLRKGSLVPWILSVQTDEERITGSRSLFRLSTNQNKRKFET